MAPWGGITGQTTNVRYVYDTSNVTTAATDTTFYMTTTCDTSSATGDTGMIYRSVWGGYITSSCGNYFQSAPRRVDPRDPRVIITDKDDRGSPREKKAEELLRMIIGERLWRKYAKKGHFMLKGHLTGKRYRLARNRKIIVVGDKGEEIHQICIYAGDNLLPMTDHLVAQVMLVMSDERTLLEKGNVWKDGKEQPGSEVYKDVLQAA